MLYFEPSNAFAERQDHRRDLRKLCWDLLTVGDGAP